MEIQEITDIISTLNLESETTLQIVQEIKPLLYWKFVYVPLLEIVIISVMVVAIVYIGLFIVNRL